MIHFKGHTLLVIAPHPDDEVYGCGGLIHRVKQEGGKVYVLYLTVGTTKDFSKKGVSTSEERIDEIRKVSRFLKYDGWRIAFLGNDYHLKLDALPQKNIIDEIERGKDISLEVLRPTIVAVPGSHDYNQDHRAAYHAAITATRPQEPMYKAFQPYVLSYEFPYSSWAHGETMPLPNFFVPLARRDLEVKLKAIRLYKSQLKGGQNPLSLRAVETLAALRGVESGGSYAEAFYAKRIVL